MYIYIHATSSGALCSIIILSSTMENANFAPDGREYKSKNLKAERLRREKLGSRLLALRALVPIITNMNKASIIEDAITYIEDLQKNVEDLSHQLLEMEASPVGAAGQSSNTIDDEEDMNIHGIKEEIKVTHIDGSKFWLKMVMQKKRSGFTRLLEAMNFLGFEFLDTSVITSKGAMIITACLEAYCSEIHSAAEIREVIQDIIRGI